MRRTRRNVAVVGLVLMWLIVLVLTIRSCSPMLEVMNEPTMTQWAEMNGKWLGSTSAGVELETLADQLMAEYELSAARLPEAEFSNGGHSIPVERLAEKFRKRGGVFGEPQLFVRLDAKEHPEVLVVSWGHLRQAILVFRETPGKPPYGSVVMAATARVYVVADEKMSDPRSCDTQHDGGVKRGIKKGSP